MNEVCTICRRPIRAMTFHKTGVCSDLCLKVSRNELTMEQAENQR